MIKCFATCLLAGVLSAHALPPTPQSSGQPPSGRGAVSPHWNTPGAGNPFIPGYFADPTIRKFGDIYYLYATTDGTGNGYGPAQVWVSYDFQNWKNIVMNWPTTEVVWAPDVMQAADGSYRYFYCEPCVLHEGVGPSPIGPWQNVLGDSDAVLVPDRFVHNAITLDGQTFTDDDGTTYIYFGTWGIYKGFGCGVARFSSDMKSFTDKKLIPNTEITDFFEAPYVFKRNGIYYFTYSSGSCHDHTYRVQYATSTAGPMGPFEYKGCILQTNDDQTVHGPGHHSILVEKGKKASSPRYYIVYHRHNLPRSVHGFNRQVCIDELTFDAQGNILPITPTHGSSLTSHGTSLTSHLSPLTSKNNLAFGSTVTASSYYDDNFRPEYAVDDNNATLWKARHGNWDFQQASLGSRLIDGIQSSPEWLQIDLGSVQAFTEVWTQFEYATFFYQYLIETSVDGQHWTLFADRTANTEQGSPMIDRAASAGSKKVKARYVRITITDTQKNGHLPAIWNVKVWNKAPRLPYSAADDAAVLSQQQSTASYPGMHRQDVAPDDRSHMAWGFGAMHISLKAKATAPFDVETVDAGMMTFKANKPLRLRIKDGRWAMFFNGTQRLESDAPLTADYRYNAPYTIVAQVLSTKVGPVSTVLSLSSSRADLANTELRLGTDPATGLVNHNGSFESYGVPNEIKDGEGRWQTWIVTYDGWMERAYLDGRLVHEQNNFIMFRPEGHVTIGADATGTNSFMGYISTLEVHPYSMDKETVESYTAILTEGSPLPSLGDDDFEETDPDSKFELSPAMRKVFEKAEPFDLSALTADFNDDPLNNGAQLYQTLEGDFVVMAHVDDMEGLAGHSITPYNEGGLIAVDASSEMGWKTVYQLGAFPLYNCGNMLTVLSRHGRPQFPNYKGYDFDPYLQFERRGTLLYARTSEDGLSWSNMPGSPVDVGSGPLAVGTYQTTYTATLSWVRMSRFVVYQ